MRTQGFSLIEVLVSLSITSISLLAITSSQITTVQLSRQAAYEAHANILLQQIAGYIQSTTDNQSANLLTTISPGEFTGCYQLTGCSKENMAAHQLLLWQDAVNQALPQSESLVCIDSTPDTEHCDNKGEQYKIELSWQNGMHRQQARLISGY